MKKIHIVILVLIAAAITTLISYTGNLTTYETVASAKEKEGKFVNLIAKLDPSKPIEYNAAKDANFLSFTAVDSLGNSVKVVYRNTKPTDMEKSERLVLKGTMQGDHFECKNILLKCPSKYKDDPAAAGKSVEEAAKANETTEYYSADTLTKRPF
ncbi:MAG: cytochrome c maturation protein CcmE [Chitinophagaceae bacterium]